MTGGVNLEEILGLVSKIVNPLTHNKGNNGVFIAMNDQNGSVKLSNPRSCFKLRIHEPIEARQEPIQIPRYLSR